MQQNNIVPFGKHKGKTVEELLRDKEYLQWLLAQDWFKTKFVNLYTVVINNGQEPNETPEHNAMQVKFLSEEYRLKFLWSLAKRIPDFRDRQPFDFGKLTDSLIRLQDTCRKCSPVPVNVDASWVMEEHENQVLQWRREVEWARKRMEEFSGKRIIGCKHLPVFEKNGVDAILYAKILPRFSYELKCNRVYYIGESSLDGEDTSVAIEIKPSLGDDFPAVLRQFKSASAYNRWMERCPYSVLLIGQYNGVGATFDEMTDYFLSSGIIVITSGEIDSTDINCIPLNSVVDFDHILLENKINPNTYVASEEDAKQ